MIRVAVIGASGYTGGELAELIVCHPNAELVGLFGSPGRSEPEPIEALFPRLRGVVGLALEPYSLGAVAALEPDAVFLATPHEASAAIATELLELTPVLDLSGAFRLGDAASYPAWYGFEHANPALLDEGVYGLCERNRGTIRAADLIAVPGCYPTASILALAPLVDAGLVCTRPVIDAISGTSGAGRGAKRENLFCEVSLRPYGVFTHRHTPEIIEHAGTDIVFTPHVAPFERGIVATIHTELPEGAGEEDARAALAAAYDAEPFVRLLPPGSWPSVGGVARTNFCDIALAADDTGHLIVVSAIDNLVKGAAGQAVQCLNIRFGFDETAGLLAPREGARA